MMGRVAVTQFLFFFQAEDGIRDYKVTGVPDVCSSDLLPRTTASALASPAGRSPRRPWNASRTASLTSLVSVGSGVWLSNGRIATVLMFGRPPPAKPDRKSTRLNSSHLVISYAVFCLKKK